MAQTSDAALAAASKAEGAKAFKAGDYTAAASLCAPRRPPIARPTPHHSPPDNLNLAPNPCAQTGGRPR